MRKLKVGNIANVWEGGSSFLLAPVALTQAVYHDPASESLVSILQQRPITIKCVLNPTLAMKINLVLMFACLWAIALSEMLKVSLELSDVSRNQSPALNTSTELHISGYDPKVIADQATWDKYAAKGGQLMCAMRFSDMYAGTVMKDTRVPPSAESMWTGDMMCEYNYSRGVFYPEQPHANPSRASSGLEEVGMERCKHRRKVLSV
jgi:hypothetical protein